MVIITNYCSQISTFYYTICILLSYRNEEMSIRLRHDIERLNRMINNESPGSSPMKKEGENQEVHDLKVSAMALIQCMYSIFSVPYKI